MQVLLNERELKQIGAGCNESDSDALFNPTPSCYGLPWTEVMKCILAMLKTEKVWSG